MDDNSLLDDPDLEAELAKLLHDDNEEDYLNLNLNLNEMLSGLRVHDSALGSDEDEARKSKQTKDRITA